MTATPSTVGKCPPEALKAIYGDKTFELNKKEAYDESLRRWWDIYAERKQEDETEEYVANSLLYDRYHAPRTAPAPACVKDPAAVASKAHHHQHRHDGHGH